MADRIIAVLGATGAQGGGVLRGNLGDKGGGFAARAITRHPDSDKAKALAAAGAEVVAADLDDVESLRRRSPGRTACSPSPTSGSTSRRRRKRSRAGTSPMRPAQRG